MREDRIRKAVKDGRTLFNAWLTLNNPFLIELIGEAGWDCLTIDQQHGLGGNEALVGCLTAARACGLPSIVRVAENKSRPHWPRARCRRARDHVSADRER
jgi:4-hydroxy-2-oxoheptanedioate aldolase